MGNFIGIGFVYSDCNQLKIQSELKKVFDCLYIHNCKILNYKYSEKNCSEQVKYDYKYTEVYNLINEIIGKYMIEIELYISSYNTKIILEIETNKELNYFGIVFYIKENELISNNDMDSITNIVIKYMIELYKVSNYDYAFCDNEAQILYSPKQFEKLDKREYSIEITRKNNSNTLIVRESSWKIDGITPNITNEFLFEIENKI